jgi:Flp pilus assembly pilin Flp
MQVFFSGKSKLSEPKETKEMEFEVMDQNQGRKKQKGVTTVEYAIMLVLIAIAVAIAAPNISSAIVSVFGKTSSVLAK